MNHRKASAIRRVLDLPRRPQDMTESQRHLYRSAKRRYTEMPSPARATFLDDVTELKTAFARKMQEQGAAPNRTGILSPNQP